MKINPYIQVQQVYNKSTLSKTEKSNSTSRTDALELSSFAKDLQIAKAAVNETADVRTDITTPIKAAIEDGTYSITGASFADKLLEGFSD